MDSSIGDLMLKMSKVMSGIADRVAKLELMAHAPRNFVTCEDEDVTIVTCSYCCATMGVCNE